MWTVIAVAVTLTGFAGTALGARAAVSVEHDKSAQARETEATEIAGALTLGLRREQDLVVSATALVVGTGVRDSGIGQWARAVDAFDRYPEVAGLAFVRYVTAADLPAYRAASLAETRRTTGTAGTFTVTPPGARPYYCFLLDVATRKATQPVPPGYDVCPATTARLLRSRSSGQVSVDPVTFEGSAMLLAVQTPVYSTPSIPPTPAARRAAFVGWLGMSVDPAVVLAAAAVGHDDVSVTMRYVREGADVAFSDGRPANGRTVVTRDIGDGWFAAIAAPVVSASLLAGEDARWIVLAGVLMSVLLGTLLLMLSTGRIRAVRMVAERTGELQHQALHDALTGLPNRALIVDRVDWALARARRQDTPIALLFVDLDGFKGINDTYGHAAGDQMLTAVSTRLVGALRESDTVGRLGGDEFVVLVEGDSLADGPEMVARHIREALSEPFPVPGHPGLTIVTRASIGVAVGLRATAGDMLRDADVALYEAKSAGKDRHVVFASAMQIAVQDRLELEMDLRGALDRDEFALAYQPTVDLRTRSITGVEALIRWNHPVRGLVMPDTFIPLAEETALVVPIGRWVLNAACRHAAAWQARGRPLPVSVNISGRQLDDDVDFVADVRDALAVTGLDPGSLTLEITETMIMRDAEASARRLRALKALGVRLAIDDFGTGYSSLAYLQQFPVDALKIDRSFITGIATSQEAGALIRTLVQLGKTLGLETLAEGIEDDDQLAALCGLGCDSGQGYLFARPLAPEALQALVESMPALVAT
jgi:diguanylate cyclase (GGDEF)-like protein